MVAKFARIAADPAPLPVVVQLQANGLPTLFPPSELQIAVFVLAGPFTEFDAQTGQRVRIRWSGVTFTAAAPENLSVGSASPGRFPNFKLATNSA